MSKVVAEEFNYSERSDTATYLERYNTEIPQWWMSDE